jgi:hypothetical protein
VRIVAVNDRAGSRELRRAHPDWPVWSPMLEGPLVRIPQGPVPDALSVELETAWPSLQWPRGLKAWRQEPERLSPGLVASAGKLLGIQHARPGSSLRASFELAASGSYRFALLAVAGPRFGDFEVTLDGRSMGTLRGYAPTFGPTALSEPTAREVTPGRHELVLTCVGRDPRSQGWDGALDVLVARPAPR